MEEKGQEREGERQNVCKRAYVAHKTYLLSDPLQKKLDSCLKPSAEPQRGCLIHLSDPF